MRALELWHQGYQIRVSIKSLSSYSKARMSNKLPQTNKKLVVSTLTIVGATINCLMPLLESTKTWKRMCKPTTLLLRFWLSNKTPHCSHPSPQSTLKCFLSSRLLRKPWVAKMERQSKVQGMVIRVTAIRGRLMFNLGFRQSSSPKTWSTMLMARLTSLSSWVLHHQYIYTTTTISRL